MGSSVRGGFDSSTMLTSGKHSHHGSHKAGRRRVRHGSLAWLLQFHRDDQGSFFGGAVAVRYVPMRGTKQQHSDELKPSELRPTKQECLRCEKVANGLTVSAQTSRGFVPVHVCVAVALSFQILPKWPGCTCKLYLLLEERDRRRPSLDSKAVDYLISKFALHSLHSNKASFKPSHRSCTPA
jgi:hypothetical protein